MTIEKEKLPVIYNSSETEGFSYELTFTRAELTRQNKSFKRKKHLLHSEVFERLDKLRRDKEGNPIFCLSKNSIITTTDFIKPDVFDFCPHEQSVNVVIKVKPFWKNKDKKQRLLGYVMEVISTVNRGGRLYSRSVGGVIIPKEFIFIRMVAIDMTKDNLDDNNCYINWNRQYSMTTINTSKRIVIS